MANRRPLTNNAGQMEELPSSDALLATLPAYTRADLNTLAAGDGLTVGQMYFITDESRIAVGTAVDAAADVAMLPEVGGGGGTPAWEVLEEVVVTSPVGEVVLNLPASGYAEVKIEISRFDLDISGSTIDPSDFVGDFWDALDSGGSSLLSGLVESGMLYSGYNNAGEYGLSRTILMCGDLFVDEAYWSVIAWPRMFESYVDGVRASYPESQPSGVGAELASPPQTVAKIRIVGRHVDSSDGYALLPIDIQTGRFRVLGWPE